MSSKSSEKYNCVIYNKLLLLSMDIENVFGDGWVVEKLYFHFNKNSIEGKYIKPYVIKFIIHQRDENEKIINTEEHKWGLNDLYEHLNIIPLYLIKYLPKSTYGVIDITDKIFPINNTELISPLLPFEDISYEFEYNHGSIIIDEVVISELEKLLTENNIKYEIKTTNTDEHPKDVEPKGEASECPKDVEAKGEASETNEHSSDVKPKCEADERPKYISVYGEYEECEPSYKINISLNGKSYNDTGFCISPEPVDYRPYKSVGKFKFFSGKIVDAPNDEHLALITKCPDCEANVICDWLSLKGTRCPYCDSIIKL